MQDMPYPSRSSFATYMVLAALAGAGAVGCDDDDGAAAEFVSRARGAWRLERVQATPAGDAYIVQTITISDQRESLLVRAYADQAKTIPLLTYDSSGPFEVIAASASVSDAFELELRNDVSLLTAHVTDPAFLSALGLDDCDLVRDQPTDISNGCGAPIFSVTNCIDLDLFQVARGGTELRTGAPGTDRCVQRPGAVDTTPYLRVSL